jgi:peptidoglycan/xylan/chitin deacetylase (PgdA/CDA1 family)
VSTPTSDSEPPGAAPAPPRRRRRWWWLLVIVLLLAGVGVVAGVMEHQAWERSVAEYDAEVAEVNHLAENSRADAEAAYTESVEALDAAIADGRPVYDASEGQVADDGVRDSLQVALDDAQTLSSTKVTYPAQTRTVDALDRPNPFRPETLPTVVADVVSGSVPAPEDLDAASDAVVEATDAVAAARRQWAFDALGPAVDDARDAVDDLDGQDVDAAARDRLDAAASEGRAILDDGVDAVDPDVAAPLRETLLDTTEALWRDHLDRVETARRDAAKADGIDCAVDKCVALTFDDGPVADTERLLKVLERRKAPATFFMVGSNVEKRPEIARAVVEAGHLVANHSWDHPQLTTLDDAEVREQLRSTTDAIEEATGFRPFLLRPPYGDVDDHVRSLATRNGLDVIIWNLDSNDWRTKDADQVHDDVMAAVEDGSNILMHDIHPTTIDAVGKIIRDLRKEDYVLVTADLLVDKE